MTGRSAGNDRPERGQRPARARATTGPSAGNDRLTAPNVKFWRRRAEARRRGFTLAASPRS